MPTADDDSGPVPHDAFKLPRAVLIWKTPPPRGGDWRTQSDELASEDTPVTRLDSLSGSYANGRASSAASDDDPTIAIQVPVLARAPERTDQAAPVRAAAPLDAALARVAKLWRDGPLRTAAAVAGAVLITYLAVGGARRGSENRTQTMLVPPAAPPAITVEQLDGSLQARDRGAASRRGEQSDRPGRKSASGRARVPSVATTPASKSKNDQGLAPVQSKSNSIRTEPSSTTVTSSSAGLPAWGAEAVRGFSSRKTSAGASVTSHAQTPTAKPISSNTDIPPPMAADRSGSHEPPQAAPAVAAKPAGPPKPAALPPPPPPSKPLTMDEMLNQVEEAAQAQRKQAGLKTPQTSKRDAELDELISGAMQPKK